METYDTISVQEMYTHILVAVLICVNFLRSSEIEETGTKSEVDVPKTGLSLKLFGVLLPSPLDVPDRPAAYALIRLVSFPCQFKLVHLEPGKRM